MGEIVTESQRPIQLKDDTEYQLVTVKRRNEGVVARERMFGREILVKNYFEVCDKDFLISKRQIVHGACGLVPKNLDKAVVSNEYMVISSNQYITTEFLALLSKHPDMQKKYLLSSYGVDIEKMVFNTQDWKSRTTVIPTDLAEQTAIGNFFKQLDETIALHQRQSRKYQKLKIGFLNALFCSKIVLNSAKNTNAWEQRKLGEIGANFYGGGTPNTAIDNFWNGHLAWLQSSDISEFDVLHSNPKKFITLKGLQNSAAKKIPSKSIAIVTRVGVGKVLLVPFEYSTSQDFLSISELKIDELFAIYAISKLMNIEKDNVQGTSIKGITKNELLDKSIFIPKDKTEQTAIGDFFKQLDKTIALHQRKIEKYQFIKRLFLEKMFIKQPI